MLWCCSFLLGAASFAVLAYEDIALESIVVSIFLFFILLIAVTAKRIQNRFKIREEKKVRGSFAVNAGLARSSLVVRKHNEEDM
jgi:hypothetical protein